MTCKRWTDSNGAIFDSYNSNYMIFINRNCDFNFLKNTDLEHIALIKDEKRIKSFVKFCERTNKTIIYIKKPIQKDVLDEITTKNYVVINYSTKTISENFDDILRPIIESKISEIQKLEEIKTKKKQKIQEEDEDEDIDMTDVESI